MNTPRVLQQQFSVKSLLTLVVLSSVCIVGIAGAQSSGDEDVDFRVSENDDRSESTLTVQAIPQQPQFLESLCLEGTITESDCSMDNIREYQYSVYNSENTLIATGNERILRSTDGVSADYLQVSEDVNPEVLGGEDMYIQYTLTFESCGLFGCTDIPISKFYYPNDPVDIPNLKPNTLPISPTYSISQSEARGTAYISIDGAIDPEGKSLTYEIRSVEGGTFSLDSGEMICSSGEECVNSITRSSGDELDIKFTNNGQALTSGSSVLGNINMVVSDPAGNSETVSVSIARVIDRDVDVILRSDKKVVEQGDSVTFRASVAGFTSDSEVQYRFSDGVHKSTSYTSDNSAEFTYTDDPQVITPSVDVLVDGDRYSDTMDIEIVAPTPTCIAVDSTDARTSDGLVITNDISCSSDADVYRVSINSAIVTESGELKTETELPDSITEAVSTTDISSSSIVHTFTHEPSGESSSIVYTYTGDREESSEESGEDEVDESPTFDAEGNIITSTQIYEVSKTYTAPHRFVDGSVESESVYEDQNVPPSRGGLGYVSEFSNIRDLSTDNIQNPAIIESDTSEGGFNTGFSYIGIPTSGDTQTFTASVDLTYSLQTTQTDQIVSIKITNAYGEVIDPTVTEDRTEILESTVEPEYQDDPFRSLDSSSIGIRQESVALTEKELQHIIDTNELYVQIRTKEDGVLLLYESNIVVSPTTKSEEPTATRIDPTDFESEEYEFDSPTFDASFTVVGSINERYETYDYRPGDTMNIDVEIENSGDLRVSRTLGIYDYNKNTGQVKRLGVRDVEIDPNSYERLSVSYEWEPHEFGHHEIRVFDITDNTVSGPIHASDDDLVTHHHSTEIRPQLIATNPDTPARHQLLQSTEDDPIRTIDVYVFQPATFEIVEIIHPDNWLIYDNFDTRVVVENVGDLDGSGEFTATFDTWSDTFTIPNTAGGNVREDVKGAQQTVLLDSETLDYSPSYPKTPVSDSLRPRSPYGSTESTMDLQVETNPNFASPVPFLYDSLTDTQASPVRIYRMEIMTVEVEERTTDTYTTDGNGWYTSGYPYYASSSSPYWTAGGYADTQGDILENPDGALPTLGGTEYLYGPLNKQQRPDEGNRRMSVRALITNNGTADSGIARVRVVTDPGREGITGQVVGTAGVRIDPYEYKYVNIPVVIPNNYGNDGIHNLEVQARTTPDYIRQTNPQAGFENQQDAMSINVRMNTWEDFLSQGINGQRVLNEQCEGYNPSTPDGDKVDCRTEEQQTLSMDAVWRNVGGETGTFEGNVEAVTTRDPSGDCTVGPCTGSSRYQSPGFVENYNPGSGMGTGNYWNNQQITLNPEQEGALQADLPFTEPGVYTVEPSPHRANNEGVLPMYEDLGTPPRYQFHTFKVLDITDPEAYIDEERNRFDCKSGRCDQRVNNDPFTIWEGGRFEVTARDSVDNVRITEYDWRITDGPLNIPNGGFDVCEGDKFGSGEFCYGEGRTYFDGGYGRDGVVHRFDEPGEYDLSVTIEDDPAYGTGASLYSDGAPNTDTETQKITVVPDNEDPYVSFDDTFNDAPEDDTGTNPVWHRYDDLPDGLSYPGVEYCADVITYDDQIGIESVLWDNFNDDMTVDGEDRKCIRFNEYPNNVVTDTSQDDRQRTELLNYTAWDFNQNTKTYTREIDVKHDGTDPTVSEFELEKGSLFDARLGYPVIVGDDKFRVNQWETFWWAESKNPDSMFVSTDDWSGDDLLLDANTKDYGDTGESAIGVACNLYSTSLTSEVFGSCDDTQDIYGRWIGGDASRFGDPGGGGTDKITGGYANVFDRQPNAQIIRDCAQNRDGYEYCFDDASPMTTGNSDRVVFTRETYRYEDPDDPGDYDTGYRSTEGDKYERDISDSAVTVTADEIGAEKDNLNILSEGTPISGGYKISGEITSTVYDWHGNSQTVSHPIDFIYDTTDPVLVSNGESSSPDYLEEERGDTDDDETDREHYTKGANCVQVYDDGPDGGVGLSDQGVNYFVAENEELREDTLRFSGGLTRGHCVELDLEVDSPRPPDGYRIHDDEIRERRSYGEKTQGICRIEYFGDATYQEKLDIIDSECPDRTLTIDDFDEEELIQGREYRYGDGGCYGTTVDSVTPLYGGSGSVPSCGGIDDDVDWNSNPPISDNHGNEIEAYAAIEHVVKNRGETENEP